MCMGGMGSKGGSGEEQEGDVWVEGRRKGKIYIYYSFFNVPVHVSIS